MWLWMMKVGGIYEQIRSLAIVHSKPQTFVKDHQQVLVESSCFCNTSHTKCENIITYISFMKYISSDLLAQWIYFEWTVEKAQQGVSSQSSSRGQHAIIFCWFPVVAAAGWIFFLVIINVLLKLWTQISTLEGTQSVYCKLYTL